MTDTTAAVVGNAEAAILELSMFFVRHSLPVWPARLAPILQALRAGDGRQALEHWGGLALMGEYGLMETRVSYELGYRCADFDREQQHFGRLLQQALDTMNNLRSHLRFGSAKPLLSIYPDSPL